MSHPVICSICGKTFDRDKVQAVRHGARRYSHAECEPDNINLVPLQPPKEKKIKKAKPKDDEMAKLKDYIQKVYGDKANWVLITRQIKQFQKDYSYTLSGILKSLMWFYEVKGNSIEGSNGGIGIVPYCYRDAFNYYYSIFIANQANQNKTISNEIKEINIPIPKARNVLKHSLINLDRWEPEDETV